MQLKEVQSQIRKLKDQLQQNTGLKLESNATIWPWLIEYAAQQIHTFKIFKIHGRSARQRLRADPTVPEIPMFAEHVYFMPAKTVAITKDEPRWRTGIWLGFDEH